VKTFSEYRALVLVELQMLGGDGKTQAVAQKFIEDLQYLYEAFDEVYLAEGEYLDYQNDLDGHNIFEETNVGLSSRKTLDTIQHQFVMKNQSYYLRLYAVISSFSKLLTCLLKSNQVPIKSNVKFLSYLGECFQQISEQIVIIQEAIKFRTYIDHPNQNKHYTWMTSSYIGTTRKQSYGRINYFVPIDAPVTGVIYDPQFLQLGLEGRPPVECEEYFTVPSVLLAHAALFTITIRVLRQM
jgi:hypothetical protein